MSDLFPGEAPDGMADPLLRWFDAHKRSMPWRDSPEPYRVWISEIMLQQTRIAAVLGYFDRFVRELPTVRHLAEAPQSRLLELWAGLGYYSRAVRLGEAARVICERHRGELPASYEELLALPGIGEYTAGAIASIAFGLCHPAVDGNVCRVMARLTASRADVSSGAAKREVAARLSHLMPKERPGDFNQAMMELGETICVPSGAPLCGACPLSDRCEGARTGCASELPVRRAKKERRVERRTILLVQSESGLLLRRRDGTGLLRGMWEPVNREGHLSREEIALLLGEWGASVEELQPLGEAKHIFSHIEWRMTGYLARCGVFPPPEGCVWARSPGDYALPSAFRAYLGPPSRLSG